MPENFNVKMVKFKSVVWGRFFTQRVSARNTLTGIVFGTDTIEAFKRRYGEAFVYAGIGGILVICRQLRGGLGIMFGTETVGQRAYYYALLFCVPDLCFIFKVFHYNLFNMPFGLDDIIS